MAKYVLTHKINDAVTAFASGHNIFGECTYTFSIDEAEKFSSVYQAMDEVYIHEMEYSVFIHSQARMPEIAVGNVWEYFAVN